MDFSKLPQYKHRHFAPEKIDLQNREEVIKFYQLLWEREITSPSEFENWLFDLSELEAAIDQVGSILYIQMTCQTDHEMYARNYQKFIETIIPTLKEFEQKINQKYLNLSNRFPLDQRTYSVYERMIQTDVELFRKENIPLLTQLQLFSQEYQTICGAMTVFFRGQEYTLPQMNKFLHEQDRSLREEAYRMMARRRLQDKDRLEELFDKMLSLRHQVALNAGCRNFVEYQFRAYRRFDYTPEDCKRYHKVIELEVLPILQKIIEKRQNQMSLKNLRPWDIQCDSLGRSPLKPFDKVEELISKVNKIFYRIDRELGTQFSRLAKMGLLNLASRKGKAPGGYQNTLAEARVPFIFMNAVGIDYDVNTLLHEGGHAFHVLACRHQPLYHYRHAPMEFCEVASMSMELLGYEYIDIFYTDEDSQRSRQIQLEGIIQILIWVAVIDAFQHWVYEHPQHSHQERSQAWLKIHQRFGGEFIDWRGLKDIQSNLWHRQLHIFEAPFYYIEYGIAQLGALQLWLNYKKNPKKTIAQYSQGLSLGGSRPLKELFQTTGLKFDFSKSTIKPLVEELQNKLHLK